MNVFFFNSNLTGYVISVRRECVGGTRRGTRQLTCLPLVSCSAASTEGDTSNIGDRSIVVGQVSPKSGLRDLFFLNPKSWNNEQTTETQGRDTTELTQDPVNKLVIKFWDCYQGMTLLIIVIDFFFFCCCQRSNIKYFFFYHSQEWHTKRSICYIPK